MTIRRGGAAIAALSIGLAACGGNSGGNGGTGGAPDGGGATGGSSGAAGSAGTMEEPALRGRPGQTAVPGPPDAAPARPSAVVPAWIGTPLDCAACGDACGPYANATATCSAATCGYPATARTSTATARRQMGARWTPRATRPTAAAAATPAPRRPTPSQPAPLACAGCRARADTGTATTIRPTAARRRHRRRRRAVLHAPCAPTRRTAWPAVMARRAESPATPVSRTATAR